MHVANRQVRVAESFGPSRTPSARQATLASKRGEKRWFSGRIDFLARLSAIIAGHMSEFSQTRATSRGRSPFVAPSLPLHRLEAGDGPPVVLLHGFPETHRSWDLQIGPLVSAGYRAIVPDLRGYGLSDKPRRGYDLETLARDVERLIDDLHAGPARVVGHDWGGAITWQLLERCPEKILNATILDCPHPALMARALRSNRRQRQRSWYMFFFQLPGLPELWLTKDGGRNLSELFRRGSPGQERAPREIVEAEAKALLEQGGLHGPLAYYRTAFRRNFRALISGRAERPRRIERPVTLIWGEQDSCLGLELIDGTEGFAPHLVVHRVPNAGHFVHQEEPARVNELLLRALERTDMHS